MKSPKTRILAILFMGIIAITAPAYSNTHDFDPIGAAHNSQTDIRLNKPIDENLRAIAYGICVLPIVLPLVGLTYAVIHDYYATQAHKAKMEELELRYPILRSCRYSSPEEQAETWRIIRARFKTWWPNQNRNLRLQRLQEEQKNLFGLEKNKMSTHITVKEGEIFTIAAERNDRIAANFIEPYITGALTPLRDSLLSWHDEYLKDKDIFQFTAREKGHHTVVITRHVRLEEDKPCARIDHDIIVHVE